MQRVMLIALVLMATGGCGMSSEAPDACVTSGGLIVEGFPCDPVGWLQRAVQAEAAQLGLLGTLQGKRLTFIHTSDGLLPDRGALGFTAWDTLDMQVAVASEDLTSVGPPNGSFYVQEAGLSAAHEMFHSLQGYAFSQDLFTACMKAGAVSEQRCYVAADHVGWADTIEPAIARAYASSTRGF